jgi:hypothetical protein
MGRRWRGSQRTDCAVAAVDGEDRAEKTEGGDGGKKRKRTREEERERRGDGMGTKQGATRSDSLSRLGRTSEPGTKKVRLR